MSTASVTSHHEERFIDLANGIRLWADATGRPDASALLLVMGANATGIAWPEPLVAQAMRYRPRSFRTSPTRSWPTRPRSSARSEVQREPEHLQAGVLGYFGS